MKSIVLFFAEVMTMLFVSTFLLDSLAAATTGTTLLTTNENISTGWNEKPPGNSSPNWQLVSGPDAGTWVCSRSGGSSDTYGLSNSNIAQGIVGWKAEVSGVGSFRPAGFPWDDPRVGVELLSGANVSLGGTVGGGWAGPLIGNALGNCAAVSFGSSHTVSTGDIVLPEGAELLQNDVNNLRLRVYRAGGDSNAVRIHYARLAVTYVYHADLVQAGYRIYNNANSITPGSALAGRNEKAGVDEGAAFRVRLNVQSQQSRWLKKYGSYKLQYSQKDRSSHCSAATNWSDIQSTSGEIRWNSNGAVANGAALVTASNDTDDTDDPIAESGVNVYQSYRSAEGAFGKESQVANGNSGLWDFSLRLFDAEPGSSYCLKMAPANADTRELHLYAQYPEIVVEGNLSVAIVDAQGLAVGNPQVLFPSKNFATSCQTSEATLGVHDQRIRVVDNRLSGNWTLSLAATGGPSSGWSSGSAGYKFNDAAGVPAGCANGQLSATGGAVSSGVYPGCSNAGVSLTAHSGLGSSAFSGSQPMSIASASGAQGFCGWDITGFGLRQRIPGNTSTGEYTIDMTITVTAV